MGIKDIIYRLYSFLRHPGYSRGGNIVFLSRIKNAGGNSFAPEGSVFKSSTVAFQGEGNTIEANNCFLHSCNILLRGEGHKLIMDEGVKLLNLRIKIIGRNNTVHIGKNSSFDRGNIISGGIGTMVEVGEDCMFAEGVDIWSTDTHSVTEGGSLVNPPKSITIGNHVWVGKDVAILKGVTIGDDAVIGMRSLVTKDILPGTLNAGSPSRQLREGISWNLDNPDNA